MSEELIDRITCREDGVYQLVIIDRGPWLDDPVGRSQAIVQRLNNFLHIALTGALSDVVPEAIGGAIEIVVETYEAPRSIPTSLVDQFSEAVAASTELQEEIRTSEYVDRIEFLCRESDGPAPDSKSLRQ